MKVCTDSCIFGAYISEQIARDLMNPKRILDIGSGTGLLSLMIAQKSTAIIDAVDIDENSFLQTEENFIESPWHKRLKGYLKDMKDWKNENQYDLIVSNPPFFENDLKPENKSKLIAKHAHSLSFTGLITSIKNNLTREGKFSVLLPFSRLNDFKDIAYANEFYPEEELAIKHSKSHPPFRVILLFQQKEEAGLSSELIIKNENGSYTNGFINLLKDYYLNIN